MSHAGAADGLNQSLFDNAVLNIQSQFAGTLLRCTPADTVCETGNVLDLLGMYPFPSSGIGAGSCFAPLATGHISSTSFVYIIA